MTTDTYRSPTLKQRALEALNQAGPHGITSREMALAEANGDVSGMQKWGPPFTLLRQAGQIATLTEKRDGHHVNVSLENVQGRDTWAGDRYHCPGCICGELGKY